MALLAKFRQTLESHGNQVSLLIVDNSRREGEERYTGHGFEAVRVAAGDNSNREFSGWDAGVADVLSRGKAPDVWIFTNDTVASRHGWSNQRAARFCLEAEWLSPHVGPWMLGEVTDCARPGETPLGPMLQWISTYAFAMNHTLLQRLGTLSPGNELLDSFFHDSYEPAHKLFRDHLDPDFFGGAQAWLIADPEESAERARKYKWAHAWHGATELNADTFDALRAKMRCVMSETFLSQRARQAGAEFRSPYDASNGRARIRRTAHYILDKISEKLILRRMRRTT